MLEGANHEGIRENSDDDGWNAIQQVGSVAHDKGGLGSAELGQIYGAEEPNGNADHDAGEPVEDEGQEKQDESQLDQRLKVQITGSFGEFIGDNRGDGVAGRKQRGADGHDIAYNHGDRHGFAEGTRESEKNRTHD